MMIFVTGGSGFVGRALIPYLVRCGYSVKALARSPKTLALVESLGATGVEGDLNDKDILSNALQKVDVVVHLAAAFEIWGDEDWFYEVNVTGTGNLLMAAQSAGVQRFIYMGAASVIGGGVPATQVDETYHLPQPPDDLYSKTKWIAEQHVIAANSPQMATMVLRPPLIWGKNHSMIEQIKKAVQQGRFVWVNNGSHQLSTVHIENLCAATLGAIEHGHGGEIYFITDGEPYPVKKFVSAWLNAEGMDVGHRSVPRPMALFFARLIVGIWKRLKIQASPPLTPGMIYMLGTQLTVSDAKARQNLHYQNVMTIEEGLKQLRGD